MASPLTDIFCCNNMLREPLEPANYSTVLPISLVGLETNSSNSTDWVGPGSNRQSIIAYNVFCLLSSFLSICGSTYQLFPRISVKMPRQMQELEMILRQNNVISHLALFDLAASLAVFIRSVIWLNMFDANIDRNLFCAVISYMVQLFYISTYFWTLFYALDTFFYMSERKSYMCFYRAFASIFPIVLIVPGAVLLHNKPNGNCTICVRTVLPNILSSYLPLIVVMVAVPILYWRALKAVENRLYGVGEFSDRERHILKSIHSRFRSFTVTFYVCWLPNVVALLLSPFYHRENNSLFTALLTLMALLNPLQGFLNSLVYNGSGLCTKRLLIKRGLISSSTNDTEVYAQLEESTENASLLSRTQPLHQRTPS